MKLMLPKGHCAGGKTGIQRSLGLEFAFKSPHLGAWSMGYVEEVGKEAWKAWMRPSGKPGYAVTILCCRLLQHH